jgi:hypothetical protein
MFDMDSISILYLFSIVLLLLLSLLLSQLYYKLTLCELLKGKYFKILEFIP